MRVRELPHGTVTFLFTDIQGSTRLLRELGAERYAAVLDEHRRVVREACERQDGVEVDTQGDAFFIAFPTAPGALAAAREAQDRLEIAVRMGIHTGTPLVTREGYAGEDGYVEALAEHRRLLRAAFSGCRGVEVDTQGDAFLYSFAEAGDAVAAAAAGQAALASGPVQVRMGLHTGKARLTGEGYAGRELHCAARVAASGHGGHAKSSSAASNTRHSSSSTTRRSRTPGRRSARRRSPRPGRADRR